MFGTFCIRVCTVLFSRDNFPNILTDMGYWGPSFQGFSKELEWNIGLGLYAMGKTDLIFT